MDVTGVNLARKWRSKTFDELIGQDVCTKILKNSLYSGHYFPVYLFAGQRGCGKTSAARIFAAAINCAQLVVFQKEPKATVLPCYACASCVAFAKGNHPDFIEIDAASHTGVDNIRSIIEASSLLPVLGQKRVYLIDEAHMLSKAAFNAFLKLLEEPPASVIFILATTDKEKIIDTVKSRCFQLTFKPVDRVPLVNHLATLCTKERIAYDPQGLQLIAKESQGCVRDALNLLEQVRFASSKVTPSAVLQVLGHVDEQRIVELCDIVLNTSAQQVLSYIKQQELNTFAATALWSGVVEALRASLWLKCKVEPTAFIQYHAQLKKITQQCSARRLVELLEVLYQHERTFAKTTAQHTFLEMILIQLCYKASNNNNSGSNGPMPAQAASEAVSQEFDPEDDDEDNEDDGPVQEDPIPEVPEEFIQPWQQFMQAIAQLNDPLVSSIIKQARPLAYDPASGQLTVQFGKDKLFFKDLLENTCEVWQPPLRTIFAAHATLLGQFTATPAVQQVRSAHPAVVMQPISRPEPVRRAAMQTDAYVGFNKARQPFNRKGAPVRNEPAFDVSDVALWKRANQLLAHFPGTVVMVKEAV